MMSKDARELCQSLAALNYDGQQTQLGPEVFERLNFGQASQILRWLGRIVAGEEEMAGLLRERLAVKLNLKALYRADLASCPELLKVARLVLEAARQVAGERLADKQLAEANVGRLLESRHSAMEELRKPHRPGDDQQEKGEEPAGLSG